MGLDANLEKKIEEVKTLLGSIAADFSPATFANSFGAEDMVLTDIISKGFPGIEVFSLDTGRLPAETYELMQETSRRYKTRILTFFPDTTAVEEYTRELGPNAFYDSIENRKKCCGIRKIGPLKRALAGKKAWITGLRQEQSPTRTDLPASEWDSGNEMQKFNPLTTWTHDDVWNYIRHFEVPYNKLHDQNYPSIGCAPCTRAVAVGEDIRAGRWWWENPETKECGLHVKEGSA